MVNIRGLLNTMVSLELAQTGYLMTVCQTALVVLLNVTGTTTLLTTLV